MKMNENVRSQVKKLLKDFKENLVTLVGMKDRGPSPRAKSLLKQTKMGEMSGIDVLSPLPKIQTELIQLSAMVGSVSEILEQEHSSPESNGYHDSEDSMDEMAQHVVVCGPYGTEPIPDISKARYDDNESLVYSRISLALSPLVGYPPSRNQVQSIPPKDTPRVRAEVYTPQRTRTRRNCSSNFTPSLSSSPCSSESSFNPSSNSSIPRRKGLRSEDRRVNNKSLNASRNLSPSALGNPTLSSSSITTNNSHRGNSCDSQDVQSKESHDSPTTSIASSMGSRKGAFSPSSEHQIRSDDMLPHSTTWSPNEDVIGNSIDVRTEDETSVNSDIQQASYLAPGEGEKQKKSPSSTDGENDSSDYKCSVYNDLCQSRAKKMNPTPKVLLRQSATSTIRDSKESSPNLPWTAEQQLGKKLTVDIKKLSPSELLKLRPEKLKNSSVSPVSCARVAPRSSHRNQKSPSTQNEPEPGESLDFANSPSPPLSPPLHIKTEIKTEPGYKNDKKKSLGMKLKMKSQVVTRSSTDSSPTPIRLRGSSSSDISFGDVVRDIMPESMSSREDEKPSIPTKPAPSTWEPSAKIVSFLKISESQRSSDSDFDMTPHSLPQSSHTTPNANSSVRKKRKRVMQKYSSDDEERVFPLPALTKGRTKKIKKEDEGSADTSKQDEGKVGVTAPRKRLDFDGNNSVPTNETKFGESVTSATSAKSFDFDSNLKMDAESIPEGSYMETSVEVEREMTSFPDHSACEVNTTPKTKLGKHVKGPNCKGKEKARDRPPTVQCMACGREVNWRKNEIHSHPRLQVATCQHCYKMWNTGEFRKSENYEIYCSLCGDGGEIVLCDYCDKSFCYSCIGRISGEEYLHSLSESESAVFECYICDPSPLKDAQELCCEFVDYFKRCRGGRNRLRSRKNENNTSCDDSEGVIASKEEGRKVSGDDQSSLKGDSKSNSSKEKNRGSRRGARRQERKKEGSSSSMFGDDSSHSEGDSPEVNSDDIYLSDSSILEKMESRKKKYKGASTRSGCSSDLDQDMTDNDQESPPGGRKVGGKGKFKKRRIGRLNYSSENSDEEEMESSKPRRKRALSSSCDEKSSMSRKAKRRSRAVGTSSEDEDSSRRLRYELSGNEYGDGDHRTSPIMNPASKSVEYRTTEIQKYSSSSDFEEVVPSKKKKKHVIVVSSSESSSANVESDTKKETARSKKRKTRRKKNLSSDDDFIGFSQKGPRLRKKPVLYSLLTSDSEDATSDEGTTSIKKENETPLKKEGEAPLSQESPSGKKRKKIRKMIGDAKLANETKTAIHEEEERKERLKKRKSMVTDEGDNRLILEQDENTKEVILEVRKSLIPALKPHQCEGIKFLYDACVENMERFSSGKANGAILAHCMGLGKTLQVIAFIDALLNHDKSGIRKVLILCPVNTVQNWKIEFFKWLSIMEIDYNVYRLTENNVQGRLQKLQRWFVNGGIIFMGYEMFRNLAISKRTKKTKHKTEFKKILLDPGADMVVCDEGHVMRNSKSSLSLIINQVKTRLRVILTGTPLQNNLLEYYTMVNFVKPNLLGTQKEFTNRFMNPITNGQCRDSSPFDIRRMKQRAHVLHTLLQGTVQRRDYRILTKSLPPKQEYVLTIRLSSVQDKLYRRFLKDKGIFEASDLFSSFAALAKVWNHPWVLKLDEQRKFEKAEREALYDDECLGGFIVSGSDDDCSSKTQQRKSRNKRSGTASTTNSSISHSSTLNNAHLDDGPIIIISSDDLSNDEEFLSHTTDSKAKPSEEIRVKTEDPSEAEVRRDPHPVDEVKSMEPKAWYDSLIKEEHEDQMTLSGKLVFLFELLEQTRQLKEKVLVFSQSLLTLDIIEEFLGKPQFGDWIRAVDYCRLDGSTSIDARTAHMSDFNKSGNERLRLFLISTRAGSLGVNLVSANRVVIFDACWNPSHDLQAIFRAYRYGQEKPVFVYRLLAQGTMEEKIYDRQVTKQSLSMRVIDEKQIGRHYTSTDLAELFTYTPPPPPPSPDTEPAKTYPKPDEDLVLSRILEKLQPEWITGFHEHNSLLRHIDDEELSEEERKTAWDQYNQQMAMESVRYNLGTLQNRLDSSQSSAPLEAISQIGTSLSHPTTSGIATVNTFVILVYQAVEQVKDLKNILLHIKLLKQKYQSDRISQAVGKELLTLEQRKNEGFSRLSEKIKAVNDAISVFLRSPLAGHAESTSKINQHRQLLYHELDELRQLTTDHNVPSSSSSSSSSINNFSIIQGNPPTLYRQVSHPSVPVSSASNGHRQVSRPSPQVSISSAGSGHRTVSVDTNTIVSSTTENHSS